MLSLLKKCILLCGLFPFLGSTSDKQQSTEDYVWLDQIHTSVSGQLLDSAYWLDDWFVDDEAILDEASGDNDTAFVPKPKGFMRVSLGWEPRENDYANFSQRIRLKLRLPHAKRRLSLVFSDHDPLRDNTPLPAISSHPIETESPYDFSLRWTTKSDGSRWTHRIGLGRGAQLYGRSAYAKELYSTEKSQLKWRASLSHYHDDGWIGRNELIQDVKLNSSCLLRFENNIFYEHQKHQWLWQQSAQLFRLQDAGTAWMLGFYVDGLIHPESKAEEYILGLRRRNALRSWFYYDIEPFVQWQRENDFKANLGIAFRLHAYFGEH